MKKSQESKVKSQEFKAFVARYSLFVTCFLLLFICYSSFVTASDKWPGVDESVVEKFAKEHGREAREPFINTDQGDLLLFVFLLAGTAGGFIAGYYWKELTENKKQQRTNGNL